MKRLAGLIALAIAVVAAPLAEADDPVPSPLNLRANNGATGWQTERSFELDWTNSAGSDPTLVAVHYRLLNADGVAVKEQRTSWASAVKGTLPETPGVYTAEVWFEDSDGEEGPADSVKLRFDNVRPVQVEPFQIPPWLGRTAFPYTLRIGYPPGAVPASGIAGYAVLLDSAIDGNPCAAKDRCTAVETNVRTDPSSGIISPSLSITGLPERSTHIHVVAVSGSGMKSVQPRNAVLRVDLTDPVIQLTGAPDDWTNKPVTLTATASDSGSGMEVGDQSTSPFTALQIDGGPPKAELGASVSAVVIADGIHSIAYYARDAAGNVNDGGTQNGHGDVQPQTATVRIDREPPNVAFSNLQDPRDPELIRVQVRDGLSGTQQRKGWIGIRPTGSGDAFQELGTEPAPSGLRARWDSDAYPIGAYEFRAVGYDLAGNASTTTVHSDGSRMVLSNPLKERSSLLAGFGGPQLVWHQCFRSKGERGCRRRSAKQFAQRPTSKLIPFGQEMPFSGRLSAGPRAPLQGMDIQIIERFSEGADPPERISTVTTGNDGAFTTLLAPGPSREITAAFKGTSTMTRAVTGSVRLAVRSDTSLQVSSTAARVGGPPLIFKGKISAGGTDIPAGGKAVQLQFKLPGVPWTEFRTIQTDGRGRFRHAYRFTDDDSRGVRFRFRAYVPTQGNWPYEPGGSEPVAVWGR